MNNPQKSTVGLLGEHLSHSYSKIIHEKIGKYPYALFPVPPQELDTFLTNRDFLGLNVTIPYKTKALAYCDEVDPLGQAIGAVNTLYFRDGLLHGTNTDYHGMKFAARRAGISFAGKKVLLLGGGGTSRTAKAFLHDSHIGQLIVAERTPKHEDGETFAKKVDYLHLPHDAEIIVNTTPVGCFPNNLETLVHLEDFPHCQGVLDVIYNPFSTPLVLDAMEKGIPCTGGLPMLVAQATQASLLFAGDFEDVDLDGDGLDSLNEKIIHQLELELGNVVLIGMPGSGKSTMGKKVAKKLNRPFVDLDKEIVKAAGKSIPELFAQKGEAFFRELETLAAKEFGKQNGLVIATGGGILGNPINIQALKQNGKLVHIERPLSALATKGRPLSSNGAGLEALYQKRKPLYEKHRDFVFENNGSINQLADKIAKLFM